MRTIRISLIRDLRAGLGASLRDDWRGGLTSGARHILQQLLSPHPSESTRGIRFQEEARAERLANLIRITYLVAWMAACLAYAADNWPAFNRINFGLGGAWLALALVFHFRLALGSYRPGFKYASTAIDLLCTSALIAAYAEVSGPVYALKMPVFLNYFCCLGLATLRFHRGLALFAGLLAAVLYLTVWLGLEARHGIAYGDSLAHAWSGKLHGYFLADKLLYLIMFGLLIVAAALNARRLVGLRMRESDRAAREQERALMAVGLAHEIKNPLGGVYGAAQLLRDEGKGDARFTEMILKDARRLQGVMEDFLRYARPFSIRPGIVDMSALARDFCREQSRLHPEQVVEYTGPAESGIRMPVRTDPDAVRQVLLNLIQNARRVQPSGVPVRLHLARRGAGVVFSVEDDGPGVPETMRANLFEPFQSASPGGTGLGLALSRKIARALGGDLTFSARSPGARFVLAIGNEVIPGESA